MMRARWPAAATVAAALLAVALSLRPAHAADPRIVSTTLEPQTATVGDRLTLEIAVEHEPGVTVEGPGFGDNFGGLEIVEIGTPSTRAADGAERTVLRYTLAAFQTGTVTVPALRVAWRGPEGAGTLMTPEQQATIRSVLAPGETELRPLKPQLDLPVAAPPPIVPALYVALFAVLTALGYYLLVRAVRVRPEPAAPAAPSRPPADVARARLDALAVSDGDAPAYYATIAETVRRYLSERFAFPAYAMTRSELEREMTRAGIDRWPARVTANLLTQCDAVQFAGFRPPPERMDADLTAAYEIIELTAPRAVVAPDAGAGAAP